MQPKTVKKNGNHGTCRVGGNRALPFAALVPAPDGTLKKGSGAKRRDEKHQRQQGQQTGGSHA